MFVLGKYKKAEKKVIDSIIYPIAIFSPLVSIPQVINVWKDPDIRALSVFTWTSYLFLSFLWFLYGTLHKDKPIILANGASFLLNLAIITGIVVRS